MNPLNLQPTSSNQTTTAMTGTSSSSPGFFGTIGSWLSNITGLGKPYMPSTPTPSTVLPSTIAAPKSNLVLPSFGSQAPAQTAQVAQPGAPISIQQPSGYALPAVGSAAYNQASQMGTSFTNSGIQSPSSLTPQNFQITNNPTVSSASTNGSTSVQDALNYAQDGRNSIFSGTNTNGYSPSDSLLSQILSTSQYSPEEQQQIQASTNAQAQLLASQAAEQRQIQELTQNGSITQDAADAMVRDTQSRYAFAQGGLQNNANSAQLALSTLGLLRQNKLGALQNVAQYTMPNAGQAITAIGSMAQSLIQTAMTTGTLQMNQDGTPNFAPYIQAAQQFYGNLTGGLSGQPGAGSAGASGQSSQSPQSPQSTAISGGTNQTPAPAFGQMPGYGSNGYGHVDMLPTNLQKYVLTQQIAGQNISYIDASRLPDALRPAAARAAAAAGIPYFSDQKGVDAVNAADQILNIVDAAKALSIRNLKPGTGGRIANTLTNWANNFLQFNPDLSNFAQLRDAAAKATTALAGGVGSGFRMNTGIIDAAVQNLPTANDSLEYALTKADALGSQVINGLKPYYPQISQTSQYGNLLQSQYGGAASTGTTVQTSSGAVNTNW